MRGSFSPHFYILLQRCVPIMLQFSFLLFFPTFHTLQSEWVADFYFFLSMSLFFFFFKCIASGSWLLLFIYFTCFFFSYLNFYSGIRSQNLCFFFSWPVMLKKKKVWKPTPESFKMCYWILSVIPNWTDCFILPFLLSGCSSGLSVALLQRSRGPAWTVMTGRPW